MIIIVIVFILPSSRKPWPRPRNTVGWLTATNTSKWPSTQATIEISITLKHKCIVKNTHKTLWRSKQNEKRRLEHKTLGIHLIQSWLLGIIYAVWVVWIDCFCLRMFVAHQSFYYLHLYLSPQKLKSHNISLYRDLKTKVGSSMKPFVSFSANNEVFMLFLCHDTRLRHVCVYVGMYQTKSAILPAYKRKMTEMQSIQVWLLFIPLECTLRHFRQCCANDHYQNL